MQIVDATLYGKRWECITLKIRGYLKTHCTEQIIILIRQEYFYKLSKHLELIDNF